MELFQNGYSVLAGPQQATEIAGGPVHVFTAWNELIEGDGMITKIAYLVIFTGLVVLLVVELSYDLFGEWLSIGIITLLAASDMHTFWQEKRLPIDAEDHPVDYRRYLVSLLALLPVCLLVGWIIESVAQAQGKWVENTWFILCLAVMCYTSFVRRRRAAEAEKTAVNDKAE